MKYGAASAVLSNLTGSGKSHGGGTNKLLKYGAPLAAGYLVSKGVSKGLGGLGGSFDWSDCDSD